jgi:hypothetical protein
MFEGGKYYNYKWLIDTALEHKNGAILYFFRHKMSLSWKELAQWIFAILVAIVVVFLAINNTPQTHVYDRYATVLTTSGYRSGKTGPLNPTITFKMSSGQIVTLAQTTIIPPKIGTRAKIEFWRRRYLGRAMTYELLELLPEG